MLEMIVKVIIAVVSFLVVGEIGTGSILRDIAVFVVLWVGVDSLRSLLYDEAEDEEVEEE